MTAGNLKLSVMLCVLAALVAPVVGESISGKDIEYAPLPAGKEGKFPIHMPTYDGVMHVFGSDGSELWTYAFGTAGDSFTGASEALIVDLDGDGVPEVLFTTYSSGEPGTPDTPAHLVVLSNTGQELHKIELYGRGSMAAPSVGDLDGDGELELVISLKDTLGGGEGGVQIWDLPGAKDNCVLWGTGRGGWLRQGYVPPE